MTLDEIRNDDIVDRVEELRTVLSSPQEVTVAEAEAQLKKIVDVGCALLEGALVDLRRIADALDRISGQ